MAAVQQSKRQTTTKTTNRTPKTVDSSSQHVLLPLRVAVLALNYQRSSWKGTRPNHQGQHEGKPLKLKLYDSPFRTPTATGLMFAQLHN